MYTLQVCMRDFQNSEWCVVWWKQKQIHKIRCVESRVSPFVLSLSHSKAKVRRDVAGNTRSRCSRQPATTTTHSAGHLQYRKKERQTVQRPQEAWPAHLLYFHCYMDVQRLYANIIKMFQNRITNSILSRAVHDKI